MNNPQTLAKLYDSKANCLIFIFAVIMLMR